MQNYQGSNILTRIIVKSTSVRQFCHHLLLIVFSSNEPVAYKKENLICDGIDKFYCRIALHSLNMNVSYLEMAFLLQLHR